jgi:hypothetical protein
LPPVLPWRRHSRTQSCPNGFPAAASTAHDVFSIGAILFDMSTGDPPRLAATVVNVPDRRQRPFSYRRASAAGLPSDDVEKNRHRLLAQIVQNRH